MVSGCTKFMKDCGSVLPARPSGPAGYARVCPLVTQPFLNLLAFSWPENPLTPMYLNEAKAAENNERFSQT